MWKYRRSGYLRGAGVTTSNDTFLTASSPSGVVVLEREGSQAAGLPNNILYGSMEWDEAYAVIGSGNRVMVSAALKGIGVTPESDRAIWTGFPGSLQLIAREGDQVPGEPAGTIWSYLQTVRMSCNSSGQVVFFGGMKDTCTGADLSGIFLREPNGQVRSLVKTGDTLMVAPRDYRVVKSAMPGTGHGGRMNGRTSITDAGLVMGTVTFTNSTSAVVRLDANRVCPADFDSSGFVDPDDFDAFIAAFESGIAKADFDKSGFVDTDDFDAFVFAFKRGC